MGEAGQLIADVTGSDYAQAAARLVLGPLGMTSSTFPASRPHEDPDAVTGYENPCRTRPRAGPQRRRHPVGAV